MKLYCPELQCGQNVAGECRADDVTLARDHPDSSPCQNPRHMRCWNRFMEIFEANSAVIAAREAAEAAALAEKTKGQADG